MTTAKNPPVDTYGSVPNFLPGRAPAVSIAPSVDELKRAWTAVGQGRFRAPRWVPTGPAVSVVGCSGGAGASAVALAIAEAAGQAVLIDCARTADSGLIAAGRSELGSCDGWARSARGQVVIVRHPSGVATPPPSAGHLVVIDAGLWSSRPWEPDSPGRVPDVFAATATVPGLRHHESVLAGSPPQLWAVAVRGERRWQSKRSGFLGPSTRAALAALPTDTSPCTGWTRASCPLRCWPPRQPCWTWSRSADSAHSRPANSTGDSPPPSPCPRPTLRGSPPASWGGQQ